MVQHIVTLCDVCYDGGKTEPAEGHIVTVAGGTWHLELCEAHRAALIYPLADVAERLGQAVKPKPAKPTKAAKMPSGDRPNAEPCLLCGHVSPRISALLQHLKASHHTNLEAVYGTDCPVCAREFESATALGVHVSRSHPEVTDALGATSIPTAFRYAVEHDDPHDVVAKVLANHGLDALPRRAAS